MHLSTHTWMRPEPLEVTFERASRLGYTSIELAGEPNLYNIPETRALLQKYKLKCWGTVTIQFGTRDLTAVDPKQRRETIQYMKDVVSLCAGLGGKIVTVVPATVGKIAPTAGPEDEWKWVVEGLREIAQLASELNVKIGLEPLNRFETYFLNRIDQALVLADEVGYDCGITFDPFHLALEEKDMFAALRACGSRIVDFHVSDNNRLGAGDGSFDWPKIISVLKEIGYDGGLAFEAMPPIDRSPIGRFGAAQVESKTVEASAGLRQFILDHGSGMLSDEYYTKLMQRTADTLRPLLQN